MVVSSVDAFMHFFGSILRALWHRQGAVIPPFDFRVA
jgi:hypothetical protein